MSFEITIANGRVWLYESNDPVNGLWQGFDCIMDAKDAQQRLTGQRSIDCRVAPMAKVKHSEYIANAKRLAWWRANRGR